MDREKSYKLKTLEIEGFKSIGTKQSITLGDINVLIGANGVGKSNLVSFFQMLSYITTYKLQLFIGKQGYADSLLYYGSRKTEQFTAKLRFEDSNHYCEYDFALTHSFQGQMMYAYENVKTSKPNMLSDKSTNVSVSDGGHSESLLSFNNALPMELEVFTLLSRCRVYQFHDTSEKASIRQPGDKDDNRSLRSDAGNLGAYLYAMRVSKTGRRYYQRIVKRIQKIMSQFEDFFLEPAVENSQQIKLQWRAKGHEHVFGAHQISDGSLRYMALATLLLQPPKSLPNVIVIDEPELGLHPEALIDLVGMIKIAAQNSQIILSTQSSFLLNFFNAEDIIVVESKDDSTVFNRLDPERFAEWIKDYSMSELWEKNLVGGRP